MTAKTKTKSFQQYLEEGILTRISDWHTESNKSIVNRFSLILSGLLLVCIFLYYAGSNQSTGMSVFHGSFFSGIHDINRALFLVPVIYAAIVYRIRGSFIVSLIFLSVVLPRAILISTYPDPVYRATIFVVASALIGFLMATGINKIESDKKARARLDEAYKELNESSEKYKKSQEQLIHADKLTSLGQFAASIAHEVNNPLSGILVYTQLLQKKIANDDIPKDTVLEYLSKMEFELIRSTKLIRNLLDFARQSSPALRKIDLNTVVTRAFELVADSAKTRGIETIKTLAPDLPGFLADFDQLQQVCTNLILNAIQAMPKGGKLALRTSFVDNQFIIEVSDSGNGISPENMRKLFTPFFTTKQEIKGVGLGLAISHGIIQRHHGNIEVKSELGKGSTFTVILPAN